VSSPPVTEPASGLWHAAARLAGWLRVVAIIALLGMMLIIMLDIGLREAMNSLLPGSIELVQLMLVISVFLALPDTFLRDEQITIDVLDRGLPPGVLARLRTAALVVTFALLAVMSWRMIPPALDTLAFGDRMSDLGIHFIWYWLPILIGSVAATAMVAVRLARGRVGESALREEGREPRGDA
jgi:TRAP-type C4-dicarboxylate transport system permease small subunit